MRKTLLFILAFLYASLIFAQSNVYIVQENFDETTLPSGWVTMGNGVNNWYVSRIFAVTKINKKNNFANIKIVRERREKVWEQLNVS